MKMGFSLVYLRFILSVNYLSLSFSLVDLWFSLVKTKVVQLLSMLGTQVGQNKFTRTGLIWSNLV